MNSSVIRLVSLLVLYVNSMIILMMTLTYNITIMRQALLQTLIIENTQIYVDPRLKLDI